MKVQKWKLLDSEYIFRRPWLTARRDRLELPDGRIHPEYYVLEYPTWVNIVAITADGMFLMVEQYRHGLGEVLTELVAGCVEEGETPLEGARRELLEETGYGNGTWEQITVLSSNAAANNNLSYSFLAVGVEKLGSQNLDNTEDIQVKLYTREEVRQMLLRDEIRQANMAAPLWKYFAMNNLL
ncbi:MAG: NUDIX hydrolase [Muribaculaceae bacterium]|nr:NUDIX hydrolase [Muribaculaceae bacterium]MDE6332495.1 NUDIX hydrolase [Muribaculaceae bacterium]